MMNRLSVTAALTFVFSVAPALSMDLKSSTVAAWNDYLNLNGVTVQEAIEPGKPFLRLDKNSDRRMSLQSGDVFVEPAAGRGVKSVPDGLIHDWIGAIFIPGAHVDDVRSVLRDYDDYRDIYKPVVMESRFIASEAGDDQFSMIWKRHVLFVTAALEAHYRVHEFELDAQHGFSIVDATKIRQIVDYGHRNERRLAPDTGSGFIWRIRSLAKYEQRDGGVYLEIEAIALSRSIPSSVQWMVAPVVNRLSSEALAMTLRETRDAVQQRCGAEGKQASTAHQSEAAAIPHHYGQ